MDKNKTKEDLLNDVYKYKIEITKLKQSNRELLVTNVLNSTRNDDFKMEVQPMLDLTQRGWWFQRIYYKLKYIGCIITATLTFINNNKQ